MLKVTLVKSKIGNTPANRATVKALGLNKIGSSNTFEDSPSIRGMIHKVKHLLKVEEGAEGDVVRRRRDGKAVSDKRNARAAAGASEAKPKAKIASTAKSAPKATAKTKSQDEAKSTKAAAKKSAKASDKATEKAKDTAGKANEDKPKRTTKKKSEEA